MNRIILLLPALVLIGCNYVADQSYGRRGVNILMVNSPSDEARGNALVEQRAIYPYHFIAGTAELNGLGRHDLDVLAGHLRDHPAPINIKRDGADAALYRARCASVRRFLEEASVPPARISFRDAAPPVTRMDSESVLMRYEAAEKRVLSEKAGKAQSVPAPISESQAGGY